MCIVLEAVLLKLHVNLTKGWVLIWVTFDPIQEIVGDGRSFTRLQYLLLYDNRCNLRRVQISLASFCHGNNSMVAAWPDPSSLWRVLLVRLNHLTPNWFISSTVFSYHTSLIRCHGYFFVLFIFVWLLFEGRYCLRRVYSVRKLVVINDSWIRYVQVI